MPKRMLIDAAHPEETRVVVTSGQRLEEFDFELSTKKQVKGNIYLAKVTRVRAVSAGRLRRLRGQSTRVSRIQRDPPRLLPDPGKRPTAGRSRASVGKRPCRVGERRGRGRCAAGDGAARAGPESRRAAQGTPSLAPRTTNPAGRARKRHPAPTNRRAMTSRRQTARWPRLPNPRCPRRRSSRRCRPAI